MNAAEKSVYSRPKWDPSGCIVARKELTIAGVTFAAGEDMPSLIELGLSERDGLVLWRTMFIDTMPIPAAKTVEKPKKKKE